MPRIFFEKSCSIWVLPVSATRVCFVRCARSKAKYTWQVHWLSPLPPCDTAPKPRCAHRPPTAVTGKEVRGMLEAATEAAERERTEKPRSAMEHSPTQEPTHTLTEMPTPFPTLGAAKKHEYELIGVPSAEPPSRPPPTHPSPAPRKCAHGGGHPTTPSEVPVVRAHALPCRPRCLSPPSSSQAPAHTRRSARRSAPRSHRATLAGATSSYADRVQQHCQTAPAYNVTQTMI